MSRREQEFLHSCRAEQGPTRPPRHDDREVACASASDGAVMEIVGDAGGSVDEFLAMLGRGLDFVDCRWERDVEVPVAADVDFVVGLGG